ncbi:MAG TPA: proton-conducting transporter membrane subunit, partial [Anaeromyxobacteraceae bacterium]|nr:proton-conducting transporter membrane subunit [Anaeromyxobacteraceae bacterium]
RLSGLLAPPPPALGAAVLMLGIASAVLGVAFALAQHDVKRLLAYHSVENVGIIAMGAGLALLGRARGDAAMALLGFAGAALHVVNHATFKSLLFLGAGAVHHACGTRDIERLGGLSRRMPRTALLFLVGAAAISGLPPLNGFVSEWLVFLGSLESLSAPRGDLLAFAVLAVPALGLVGGLAAACFVKVHGAVFLGTPRSSAAEKAHEAPASMLLPMAVLAAACAAIGLAPAAVLPVLERAAAEWSGLDPGALATVAADAAASASRVSLAALALLAALGALWLLRWARLREPQPRAATWGCGFTAPTARMQYTGSSFAEMLVQRFLWAFRPHVDLEPPRGFFPRRAAFASEVPDTVLDRWLLPALRAGERLSARLRAAVPAGVHFQAVLVLATLVVLLAWRFLLA